ncbi:Early meiotic induction protein 1 [Apiospora arundinis]
MGWLWATPEPSKASNDDKTRTAAAATPSPAKESENDYGDPEIAKFMAQIQREFGSGSSSRSAEASRPTATESSQTADPSKSSSSSSSLWSSIWGSSPSSGTSSATPSDHKPSSSSPSPFSLLNDTPTSTRETKSRSTNTARADDDAERPQPLDPLSESLLPTTMSCRQAFDAAFYCQGVGSQFHSIYRAGTVRSCSEHWDDFWFCMRNRTASGPRKEEAVRDYYRRREWNKYGPGRPSSADVWESRDEKVPYDSAFRETYESPTLGDEEWRVKEMEHRRAVQEALAKDDQQQQQQQQTR